MSESRNESTLEIYEDECGTYWLSSFNRTADEAIAIVKEVDGDDPDWRWHARLVHGRISQRDGEPYFELDRKGPDEMWEVEAA